MYRIRLFAPDEIRKKYWMLRGAACVFAVVAFIITMYASFLATTETKHALVPALLLVAAVMEISKLVHRPAARIEEKYGRYDGELILGRE